MTQSLPDFQTFDYKAISILGNNWSGGRVTYKALDRYDEFVVIKQFRFATENSGWSGYKSLEKEIAVLKKINHPRIPRYVDSFDE